MGVSHKKPIQFLLEGKFVVMFYVITVSYKRRFLEKHPDLGKTRMTIVGKGKFDKVERHGVSCLKNGSKFKRLLTTGEDAPVSFKYKYEAYEHALRRQKSEQQKGRTIEFDDSGSYQIYIMQMRTDALAEKRMKRENDANLLEARECFYVGLTEKQDVSQRYLEHLKPKGTPKSTPWGREYFLRPFEKAYRKDLLEKFEIQTGLTTSDLISSAAHIREADVAKWLRSRGLPSYFK